MAAGSTRSLPIRIEGVTKRYGGNAALDAVELDIKAAEFLTMLGPSGSGKTTLLMVLAGFVRPESGRVNFGKTDVTLLPPHRRNVGMVFQSYALFPHMNVAENVMYPLRLRGIGRDQARTRAEEVLGMMHLAGFGERRIDQLSGGQQQRVALARAIVFEPPILLMDEPLSALDKKLRESMQAEIRRIHERVGATTVYVTHDQREALVLSDRVAVINGGQLLQVDTPERIYHAPANLFVADFIGDSHFLPVERSDRQVLLDGRPLRLPSPPPGTSETLTLVVRPEKLELLAARDSQTHNVLTGRVEERIFLGDAVMLTVRLDGGTAITVKIQARHGLLNEVPDSGTAISLGLHPEDTILLPRGATSGAALPAEPSGDG